jgi:hypothetical protein
MPKPIQINDVVRGPEDGVLEPVRVGRQTGNKATVTHLTTGLAETGARQGAEVFNDISWSFALGL